MDMRTIRAMRPEEFEFAHEGQVKRGNAYLRVTVRLTPATPDPGWIYRADEIDLENRPRRIILAGRIVQSPRTQSLSGAVSMVWRKVDDALDEENERLLAEG